MAGLDAKYLADVLTRNRDEDSDTGLLSRALLDVLRTKTRDAGELASKIQMHYGEGNVPTWL